MKKLFERKEMKYLISARQEEQLLEKLQEYLVPDVYPQYEIQSVYYDTADFDLFRRSIERPFWKQKLRLRCYGRLQSAADMVFFELKKKFDGIVYKRRIDLPLSQAAGFADENDEKTATAREIRGFLNKEKLEPKMYVSCLRHAFTWVFDPELRITFDKDLYWRTHDLQLHDPHHGERIVAEDMRVLEIKSQQNFPLVLVRTLEELKIKPCSFSKAGQAYKQYISKGVLKHV